MDEQDAGLHDGNIWNLLVPPHSHGLGGENVSRDILCGAVPSHLLHLTRDRHVLHLLQSLPLWLDEPSIQIRIYKDLFMFPENQGWRQSRLL